MQTILRVTCVKRSKSLTDPTTNVAGGNVSSLRCQAMERYKREYENRNDPTLPPMPVPTASTSTTYTESLIQRMTSSPDASPQTTESGQR